MHNYQHNHKNQLISKLINFMKEPLIFLLYCVLKYQTALLLHFDDLKSKIFFFTKNNITKHIVNQ